MGRFDLQVSMPTFSLATLLYRIRLRLRGLVQVRSDQHDGFVGVDRGSNRVDRLHSGDGRRISHDVSTPDRSLQTESTRKDRS